MRYINLPAIGIKVSIGQYVKAVKLAMDNPDAEFKHGLTCWWPCKGSEIVQQFREGLHARINEAIPTSQRGKK